ncbi:MAG: NAD(P)H-dependent glycerol-3-phosphate dehydrogenase [Verrucomicrobiota bacterium]|nr:NAD(P)H-dependent glycerol-3-phosphate dehydrogenase [Verrucomicrobiota bacterium]
MNICVLSDGGWGTAIALNLIKNEHNVTLWGPFADYIEEMKLSRENTRFLKGISLPDSLSLTSEIEEAVNNAEMLILASPSQFMRPVLKLIKDCDYHDKIFVDVAKGIEVVSLKRISEIVFEELGRVNYSVLSGPSHAEEVAKGVPTAVVVASEIAESANIVQDVFMNDKFRVYTSEDTVGVELGGALKNIFAIAAGICDGMRIGDNSKAALITRAIVEMGRLGKVLGGKKETFAGLSGIGDMIVTCTSGHSRNRHVGEKLGEGLTLEEIQKGMGMVVAEGVKTTNSAYHLAKKYNVTVPIISEVYKCLYSGKRPMNAINDLMTRSPKMEKFGE